MFQCTQHFFQTFLTVYLNNFVTLSSLAATGKGILHCLDFARVCLAGEGLPRSHLEKLHGKSGPSVPGLPTILLYLVI